MNGDIDVAIVGAGPYGLSLAAHLRDAGVPHRVFGLPMALWRSAMPRGMMLKSQGFASNLSAPRGTHTLEAFCAEENRPYRYYGLPVRLQDFVDYGLWFQQRLVPELEEALVTKIVSDGDRFSLTLNNGESLTAHNVVVATGVEHFNKMPAQLAELSPGVCTHSSAHTDLARFDGKEVAVMGAGQAALESAALLHEAGAHVQVIARAAGVRWNGPPLAPDRRLSQRLREPEAGVGSGWATWFYSNHPQLFRRLPRSTRVSRARTALGPAGAAWLRTRVENEFPVVTGHQMNWATEDSSGVRLGLSGPGYAEREIRADHVIAATGYRPDLERLTFIDRDLRSAVRTIDDSPWVGAHYQSSVPGLYFVGPAVAPSYGPVMRFVYGSDHAVRAVSSKLSATRRAHLATTVGASR
jgi:thioredoxin reductase